MNLAFTIEQDLYNATDMETAIAVGLDAAEDEERGRWRIAALVNQIDAAYGKASVKDFAKAINRKRTYVYEAGQTLGFYGLGNVLELTENRVVTFSHMRDAMRAYRKVHPKDQDAARDAALLWLDTVANDLMTVEQASIELKKRTGNGMADRFQFTARVVLVGKKTVVLALDEEDMQRFKLNASEGTVLRFSAHADKGDE